MGLSEIWLALLFFFKSRRVIQDVVAKIRSEPRLAENQHNRVTSLLKYDGLEIHVVDDEYVPAMRPVCTQLEEALKEPVKLVI